MMHLDVFQPGEHAGEVRIELAGREVGAIWIFMEKRGILTFFIITLSKKIIEKLAIVENDAHDVLQLPVTLESSQHIKNCLGNWENHLNQAILMSR